MDTPCALCGRPAHPGAPVALCLAHLLEAHDWVDADLGATDVLPSPCAFCGSRLGVRYPSGWLCAVCEWRVGEPPPESPVVSRVDVVYYLRYRDRIKIGTTANPAQRFAALPHDEVLDRTVLLHRLVQRQDRGAGAAEHGVDALGLEDLDDRLHDWDLRHVRPFPRSSR